MRTCMVKAVRLWVINNQSSIMKINNTWLSRSATEHASDGVSVVVRSLLLPHSGQLRAGGHASQHQQRLHAVLQPKQDISASSALCIVTGTVIIECSWSRHGGLGVKSPLSGYFLVGGNLPPPLQIGSNNSVLYFPKDNTPPRPPYHRLACQYSPPSKHP